MAKRLIFCLGSCLLPLFLAQAAAAEEPAGKAAQAPASKAARASGEQTRPRSAASAADASGEQNAGPPPSMMRPFEQKARLISMTVVTEESIQKCHGCDLLDILERAGAQVRRYHLDFPSSSDSDAAYSSLRGATDAQTDLFVDGVRQEDAMLAEPVWTFIPVHHIQRIEILKGPQIMHGSPIGGVIHIFTKKANCPIEKPLCMEAISQFSNKPHSGHTGFLSGHFRSQSGGARLSAQGDYSEDEANSGSYREKFITLNFDRGGEKLLTEGSASFYDSASSGAPRLSEPGGGSRLLSLGSTYYVSPHLLFQIITGYNRESQSYVDEEGALEEHYASRRISIKGLGKYTFDFKGGAYELTAGLETQRERISSYPGINDAGGEEYPLKKQRSQAAFSQIEIDHGPFAYQVAARADDLSGGIYEGVWTWSSASSWHVAQISGRDLFIRTGAGTGFRSPGFDERFLWFDPDLELEKSKTYEIGIRLEEGVLSFFDAAIYETRLENTVSLGETTQTSDGGQISGLEAEAGWRSGQWSGNVRYTYTDTQNMRRARGHNPVRHLASLGVDYAVTPKLSFGSHFTHRGGREIEFGDHVNLLDVSSSYSIDERARLSLAIRNIADERYSLGRQTFGSGRAIWVSFKLKNF